MRWINRKIFIRWIDGNNLRAALIRIVNIFLHPLKMTFIQHCRVLLICEQRRVHFGNYFSCNRNSFIHFALRQHDVVRRNANLSRVQHLAHHDALDCLSEVSSL